MLRPTTLLVIKKLARVAIAVAIALSNGIPFLRRERVVGLHHETSAAIEEGSRKKENAGAKGDAHELGSLSRCLQSKKGLPTRSMRLAVRCKLPNKDGNRAKGNQNQPGASGVILRRRPSLGVS